MNMRRFVPMLLPLRQRRLGRSRLAHLWWGWLGWVVLFSAALTLGAIGTLTFIPAPSTIAIIEGKTEYLQYRSFNPQLSAFSVNGLRVAYADQMQLEGRCLEGTLVPRADAIIAYTKRGGDPLSATVEGGGELRRTGSTTSFDGGLGMFADADCGELHIRKLPVWGPGQVGNAFTVRQDGIGPVLITGNLSVFGRTVDLGWFGQGGALYAASGQPIALPPGGWIWTDGTSSTSEEVISPEEAALFGFLNLSDDGFFMSLTTETPLLQIVAPGGRLEPNRVEIGMFAQILNDPNVLRLQLIILVFFFLLPIVTELFGLALSRPERKNDAG